MWNHLEADRLFDIAAGIPVDSAEQRHFDGCEFCQEMLRFFKACIDMDKAAKSDAA
jgi:hypothetical protein